MKNIVLFGAGNLGKQAIEYYGKENVLCFIDNNVDILGLKIHGKEIMSIEGMLEAYSEYNVVITPHSNKIRLQLGKQLLERGINYYFFEPEECFKDNESIFDEIYSSGKWGEGEGFYSGVGSHQDIIINPYIDLLRNLIKNNNIYKICDLGCGDFNIMQQVFLMLDEEGYNYDYIGYDVVKKLVNYNNEKYQKENIEFRCEDLVDSKVELPQADLVVVRQVLQHLSNKSISLVLNKLKKYHMVLVTEHIYMGDYIQYNLDKKISADTRLTKFSGVYLDKPPYNYKNIVHLLEIPSDGGIIRTSLIIN